MDGWMGGSMGCTSMYILREIPQIFLGNISQWDSMFFGDLLQEGIISYLRQKQWAWGSVWRLLIFSQKFVTFPWLFLGAPLFGGQAYNWNTSANALISRAIPCWQSDFHITFKTFNKKSVFFLEGIICFFSGRGFSNKFLNLICNFSNFFR